MWLITTPNPQLFEGTRWLRPGGVYHIGRQVAVKQPDTSFSGIEDIVDIQCHQKANSVSKFHLIIKVSGVEDAWSNLTQHSSLTFQDFGARRGSLINGKHIIDREILEFDYKTTSFEIYLGNTKEPINIQWQPVVFSLHSSKLLPKYESPILAMDMKCFVGYNSNTTHSVAVKRNITQNLQALVNGKPVVAPEFLDQIIAAAQRSARGEPSPLEEDFDRYWPDPMKFVPPEGKEPVKRPASMYAADEKRKTVFEGMTFVFCDDTQYQSFLGPVTDGGGKVEKVILTERTTADDIARVVLRLGGILVRWVRKGHEGYDRRVQRECMEKLGMELVEQNEFLDVILTCDTSVMKRPFHVAGTASSFEPSRVPDTVPITGDGLMPDQPAIEATPADAPRGRRKKKAVRTSDIMNDFFAVPAAEPNPTPVVAPPTEDVSFGNPEATNPSLPSLRNSSMLDPATFDPTSSQAIPDSQDEAENTRPPRASSKRPHSSSDDEGEDLAFLAPNAEAFAKAKRRRLAEQAAASEDVDMVLDSADEEVETKAQAMPPPKIPASAARKGKQAEPKTPSKGRRAKEKETQPKSIDEEILEASRSVLQEESSSSRTEENVNLSAEDIQAMKALAIVELIDLPQRKPPPTNKTDDRWKPEWTGRANFKKFRKVIREERGTHRASRIIVGLVEADSVQSKKRIAAAQPSTRPDDEPSSDEEFHIRRSRPPPPITSHAAPQAPMFRGVATASASAGGGATLTTQTQNSLKPGVGPGARGTKRPAEEGSGKTKRVKGFFQARSEDEDSGDEFRFRFKKK